MASQANSEEDREWVDKKRDEGDEEENGEVEWVFEGDDEEEEKVSLMIVGKLWTNRHVNDNALINTIRNVWQPKHGMEGSCIGKNMYTFQFFHWRDKERVLEDQPWHFERHALLLSEINNEEKPSEMQLKLLPVWARIYDLPFKGRGNETNIQAIASKLGTFVKLDKRGDMELCKSLRVRVLLDLTKPLKDKVPIKMRGGITKEVAVKYEKLPLFCFICGKLGHGEKDCDENKGDETPKKSFGAWMKASPWRVQSGADKKEKEQAHNSCERRLFTAKPKRKTSKEDHEFVKSVVEQLSSVMLGGEDEIPDLSNLLDKGTPEAIAQNENPENTSTDRTSLTKEQSDEAGNLRENDEEQQQLQDQEGNPDKVSGKKWRRMSREGKEGHSVYGISSGSKRSMNPVEYRECVGMDIDQTMALKKRGAEIEKKDKKEEAGNSSVAGLTNRALGEQ